MHITTNNNRRRILDSWDLTVKEAEQFDYLDWDKLREGTESASFFRFKGEVYYLGEFVRTHESGQYDKSVPLHHWDGYMANSFSTGMLVKYADDDMIIVGTYMV